MLYKKLLLAYGFCLMMIQIVSVYAICPVKFCRLAYVSYF